MSLVLFLGGTCSSEGNWRDHLIPILKGEGISYFDPRVDNWDSQAQEREKEIKKRDNTVELYVITKNMKGVFSIAEAVDSSNKKPDKTIFLVKEEGFDDHQLKSLRAVEEVIEKNGGHIAKDLNDVILIMNNMLKPKESCLRELDKTLEFLCQTIKK